EHVPEAVPAPEESHEEAMEVSAVQQRRARSTQWKLRRLLLLLLSTCRRRCQRQRNPMRRQRRFLPLQQRRARSTQWKLRRLLLLLSTCRRRCQRQRNPMRRQRRFLPLQQRRARSTQWKLRRLLLLLLSTCRRRCQRQRNPMRRQWRRCLPLTNWPNYHAMKPICLVRVMRVKETKTSVGFRNMRPKEGPLSVGMSCSAELRYYLL
ncbi:hypothetical protein TraAM80_04897, partial [Trypanosoma rangeli]